ncbi:MAG TPA: hypothetical protein PKE31_13800 [Pseudomonadota bacterium]|nr:hypothetical protein [Pseudomonadota bacterium]
MRSLERLVAVEHPSCAKYYGGGAPAGGGGGGVGFAVAAPA